MLDDFSIATDEVLSCACNALGGLQALADSVGVTKSDVQAWLEGERNLPFGIAVRVLEVSSAANATWPFPSIFTRGNYLSGLVVESLQ